MPEITVTFFGALRHITGVPRLTLEIPPGTTVGQLKTLLLERYPELEKSFQGIVTSIGEITAEDDERIPDGAHIALFHPIAGGSEAPAGAFPTLTLVTEAPLDLDALVASITAPTTGAVVFFTGVVRGRTGSQETAYLEYEAYREMAEAKLQQVAAEIRQRWPKVEGIVLVQRIGKLAAGTPTVLGACAAPHRNDGAFEAARYGIDRLKEIVPVWKKEIGPSGQHWVHGHYRPTASDELPPANRQP
jgi:molybdopterin synthase catalytic subunit